jgi:glycosyltransferase involved in cell wall biosynthesis
MAERAIEILSNPDLQRRLGRNGRYLAEGKFNVNRVVPKYREFYERVIG